MNFKKYILLKNGCFKAEKLEKVIYSEETCQTINLSHHKCRKCSYKGPPCVLELKKASKLVLATRLLLVKCYDNKMV